MSTSAPGFDDVLRRLLDERLEPLARRVAELEARAAAVVVEVPQPLAAILKIKAPAARMIETRDAKRRGGLAALVAGRRGRTRLYLPSTIVRYFARDTRPSLRAVGGER